MKKRICVLVMLAVFLTVSVPPAMAKVKWFGPIHLEKTDDGSWAEDIAQLTEFSNLIVIEQQGGTTNPAEMARGDVDKIVLASDYGAKTVVVLLDLFFEWTRQLTFNFNLDYYLVDCDGNFIYENTGKIVAIYDFATGNLWGPDGHYMGQIVTNSDGTAIYTTQKGNVIRGIYNNKIVDIALRSDCAERWEEYAQIIEPYAENVWGVIFLDEPYLRAIRLGISFKETRESLNQAITLVKETFPAMRTVSIFSTLFSELDQEYYYGIPIPEKTKEEFRFSNFDVVGFDYYYSSNSKMTLKKFKSEWREKFRVFCKFLLPEQEILLVPGTFYFEGMDPPSRGTLLSLANFYYCEIALRDSRITAIVPFLWESIEYRLVGMKDLPNEVFCKWKKIGQEIKK